ncbi:RNase P modulator RnpM [Chordicoccus furentiruminis]|uniref:RNase P modulator RnpM n=1 Tax=Chordicoccus furentiruminis TaxID=2709410 RepID=UPI0023A86BD0|nr:YlxR family protein [Chordicoccus furentiruminis]
MQTNQALTRKKTPERTCLGCRTVRPKSELIRVVRKPDGSIALDPTGRINGRGAYLCRNADCLRRALKSGALASSLKTAIPAEIGEALLEEIKT